MPQNCSSFEKTFMWHTAERTLDAFLERTDISLFLHFMVYQNYTDDCSVFYKSAQHLHF